MMKFFIFSAAIVIAVTSSSSVVTVSAFAAPSQQLIQGTKKCGDGGPVLLSAATLETAEETKTIVNAAVVGTINGDAAAESTTTTAPAVEKAWPVMSDNFVKDSDRVLP